MAKKRKAPSSQQTNEQKPKIIREEVIEEEEEEETSEEEEQESEEEEEIRSRVADSDPTHRKIFVHGLGWDATSEQLVQAFKPFGEIEESKLITDKNTGRAKGYAFVLFKTRAAARKALKVPQKRIGSRTVSCQLAAVGPAAATAATEAGSRKIYVGNVGPHVSAEKLKAFFGRFGEIEEGQMGWIRLLKVKGFAIVTYKSPEGYKKAMEEPIKFGSEHRDFGTNLNASGLLMAHNPGIGLAGNAMMAAGYNPAGLVASGLSTPVAGMTGNYGINSMSPGVIGNYGSQAALHGLGAFQNAQTGKTSIGTAATATTATRAPTSGVSTQATFPSYFSR
ncbi:UNVERIFIED_CONTAM: UBP1-associated protein 2A [Sesamum radiatum]|uniref:UBP1-associated protein 2A n=1 Tax=Sesamum radiatum TaxID=300843 RepID=A0AAW2NBP2_SESRA